MTDFSEQSTSILIKLLSNVTKDPSNAKFRRIRMTNPKIAEALQAPAAIEFLALCGFEKDQEEDYMCLPKLEGAEGSAQLTRLQSALHALTGAAPKSPEKAKASASYTLSRSLGGHGGDVRCCATLPGGEIVTGALDNTVRVWSAPDASGTEAAPLTLIGHETSRSGPGVLALTVSDDLLLSGGRDGKIIVWDPLTGTATRTLTGHGEGSSLTNAQVVCSLGTASDGEFISGSWDTSARVWEKDGSLKHQLKEGHQAAVLGVTALASGEVLTACGDGKVRMWRDGSCVKTVVAAGLPLRGVTAVEGVGFAVVSNDSFLRLFSQSGDPIAEINTGGETLFGVATNTRAGGDFPEIIVGGDGGTCKVYTVAHAGGTIGLKLVESIPHPSAVYGVAVTPEGDIVTACEDGTARVLTRVEGRRAPAATRELFEAQAQAAQAMHADNPPVVAMAPPAATALGPVAPGPPWQHVYPVEMDTGGKLEICWNSGEEPNAIAMRFLSANPDIPKDQVQDIVNFIHQAAGQTPAPAPAAPAAPRPAGKRYEHTFPVELDTGASLQIGWDTGEAAETVAARFLAENPGIPPGQQNDIISFIQQATSQTPSAPAGRGASGISAADQQIMVRQCMEMGFDEATARNALEATGWLGVEAALNKLFQ